ncbi:MAG: Fic family protein [Deltaproteobacteria bacterium]|nr:Fic family protein [Deltaproteobacteria bacterium]PWB63212.1 MAG: cell filamentation protein Fic [Deltaproteobacteria bacterium]
MKPFIPQRLPIVEVDWEPLIPLIGRANRALAQYDGVLYGVPNPEVLLSPLTTQEAVLSSRIEGTQVTLGEVLKFEAGEEPELESRREDIQEIINYRHALLYAEAGLHERPFNLNLLLSLHEILLDSVRGRDRGRGHFRTVQNFIGKPGSKIEEADFIPPEPTRIMEFLDNWEKYYHIERPDPLVQLALIHAQFEIIHPFVDGNGRLGRILIPIFLYEKKLLRRPMFYLSGYLAQHRDEYVRRLRDLGHSEIAWNAWIEFFLSAVEDQARENAEKARAIMDLYEHLKKRVIDVTRSRYAVPLLDQLFKRPVFQGTHLKIGDGKSPSRQLVTSLLRVLREEGVLTLMRGGRGRQGQVLALGALVNLCEGKTVI